MSNACDNADLSYLSFAAGLAKSSGRHHSGYSTLIRPDIIVPTAADIDFDSDEDEDGKPVEVSKPKLSPHVYLNQHTFVRNSRLQTS